MLICNGEMILDYSDVLDKKISDLNGEAFEILDDYIWDNTLSPKETFLGFSVKKAFDVVSHSFLG